MNSLHTSEAHGTREEFAEALLDYINNRLPIVHPKAAGHEAFERWTPLFEVGGIDSLSIIHIVTFLEAAMGSTLSLQDINMKNCRRVDQIADLYWQRKI
jgi:Phosphopantetheine attachment site